MRRLTGAGALLVTAAISLTGLAGCGGDESTGDPTPATTAPGAEQTPSGSDSEGGSTSGEVTEKGSITINGTVYPVTALNRCNPGSARFDLDLQALAQGVKINLYGGNGAILDVSVDGSQVKAEYGSIAFGKDPNIGASTVTTDRTTGTATVGDSYGTGDTVDIAWDVMVPAEARDCSL